MECASARMHIQLPQGLGIEPHSLVQVVDMESRLDELDKGIGCGGQKGLAYASPCAPSDIEHLWSKSWQRGIALTT